MITNNDAWAAIYTTPTCPNCHALKAWLNAASTIQSAVILLSTN